MLPPAYLNKYFHPLFGFVSFSFDSCFSSPALFLTNTALWAATDRFYPLLFLLPPLPTLSSCEHPLLWRQLPELLGTSFYYIPEKSPRHLAVLCHPSFPGRMPLWLEPPFSLREDSDCSMVPWLPHSHSLSSLYCLLGLKTPPGYCCPHTPCRYSSHLPAFPLLSEYQLACWLTAERVWLTPPTKEATPDFIFMATVLSPKSASCIHLHFIYFTSLFHKTKCLSRVK